MDRVPVDSEMGTPRSRHGDVQNCSSFCLVSVGKSMGGSDLSWIPKPVKTQIPQWSHEGPGIFVFFELTFFLNGRSPKPIGSTPIGLEVSHHFFGFNAHVEFKSHILDGANWIFHPPTAPVSFFRMGNNVNM